MGGHSFEEIIYTEADAEAAYEELVDQAVHEYGSSGYNGTISTTSGVIVVRTAPLRLADAVTLSSARLHNLSKRGKCEAIPIVKEVPAAYQRDGEAIVDVDVSAAVFQDAEALRKVIGKRLGRPAHEVESWRPANRQTMNHVRRVRASATKGTAQTRYFVIDSCDRRLPDWDRGFPTQASARKAFERVNVDAMFIPSAAVEVIGITRRVDGQPLVTGTVEVKQVTGSLAVRLRRKVRDASVGTERAGWYIYGWAAS